MLSGSFVLSASVFLEGENKTIASGSTNVVLECRVVPENVK